LYENTMKENLIQVKSFQFSIEIIKLYKKLREQQEFVISKQILRSGTSIWANVEEAIAGQSKKDFLTKIFIALKETRETKYRLRLLQETDLYEGNVENYLKDIESVINILTKITKTTWESLKK